MHAVCVPPAQHAWSIPPQVPQTSALPGMSTQPSGLSQAGLAALATQHGCPDLPHDWQVLPSPVWLAAQRYPAVQAVAPVAAQQGWPGPPQVPHTSSAPAVMSMHPSGAWQGWAPAQHGWAGPPHGWHLPALAVPAPRQRAPAPQAVAARPEQQGSSAPPQATQPVPTQRCPAGQAMPQGALPGSLPPLPLTPPVAPAASTTIGGLVAPSRPTGQGT
jgi:hypothetical protein